MTFEKGLKELKITKNYVFFYFKTSYLMKIRITKKLNDVRVRISFKKKCINTATDLSITTSL
jgi:hypothetical protein